MEDTQNHIELNSRSPLIVHQECFKTLKDFDNNPTFRKGSNNPGVYMWGFSLEKTDYTIPSNQDMFVPFYVGKVQKRHGCMYARTQEHLGSIMGGNTSIFDIIEMHKRSPITQIGNIHLKYKDVSKKVKKTDGIGPNLPNSTFPDLLHYPEGIHRMLHFTNDLAIKNQVDWMLRHFCITYFSLETYDRVHIIKLEKFIGNLVGCDRIIAKRYKMPNLSVEIIDSKSNIKLEKYDNLFEHCREQMTAVRSGI